MFLRGTRPLVAAAVVLVFGSPAVAQVDYRNLDHGLPSRVADAYPVERYAFELAGPARFALQNGNVRGRVAPQLDYGVASNVMVGVGLDLAVGGQGGEPSREHASLLWNVRRETPGWPALSVVFEASSAKFDDAGLTAGVLATRSFGRSRLHANLVAAFVEPKDALTEPVWWVGLGWDYTLFRTSTLVVVDLVVAQEREGLPRGWDLGAGIRRQLSPTLVVHGGVSRSLGTAGEGTQLTMGLSHAFAIKGLMPGRRR
jgi:hypothetical protein